MLLTAVSINASLVPKILDKRFDKHDPKIIYNLTKIQMNILSRPDWWEWWDGKLKRVDKIQIPDEISIPLLVARHLHLGLNKYRHTFKQIRISIEQNLNHSKDGISIPLLVARHHLAFAFRPQQIQIHFQKNLNK